MRLEESHREKERLAALLKGPQPFDRFARNPAIRIALVGNVSTFVSRTSGKFAHITAEVFKTRFLPGKPRFVLRRRVRDRFFLKMRHAPRHRVFVVAMADMENFSQTMCRVTVRFEMLRKRYYVRRTFSQ